MLRLTLAQMRRSIGRLVAAGVAIIIGTAFLTATLLASATMTRTTYDAVTSTFADADLVVATDFATSLDERGVAVIREVPGVDAVHPLGSLYVELHGPAGPSVVGAVSPAEDPRLEPADLRMGDPPAAPDEIALPDDVAGRLGVDLGGTVTLRDVPVTTDVDGVEEPQLVDERLRVVGLLDGAAAAFLGESSGLVHPELLARVEAWQTGGTGTEYDEVLVAVGDGVGVGTVQSTLAEALPEGARAYTQDQYAAEAVAEVTGNEQQLTVIVLGFAAVALLVASLVIANTFQVLVAQRTRTLALLRCVGADRRQLRGSVVLEATLLGLTASFVGVVVGTAVVQLALAVLGGRVTDVPLPTTVPVTVAAVVVPVLVGVVVTVLAALAPARAATRVPPLAALQPAGAPRLSERAGRVRFVLAVLLATGGLAGLALGVVVTRTVDPMLGLGLGLLGGAVSFAGVLVGAVFWVPRLVRLLGGVAARSGGPAGRLAAANSVRNPRRTAATSSALLIGVTLVVMMATGAASTRTALTSALDEQFPVDVLATASGTQDGAGSLPPAFVEQVRGADGVRAAVELRQGQVVLEDGAWVDNALAADPDALRSTLRQPAHVEGLAPGVVVVPAGLAPMIEVTDGDTVDVARMDEDGQATGAAVTLEVSVTSLPGTSPLLTPEDLDRIVPDAPAALLWVTLEDLTQAPTVVGDIEQLAVETGAGIYVAGAAVERAFYQRVVDTLLAVVVGLLAVAVVIAVVGVANTLSLSVLERRRESATLRALGLSKRQLRGTLAVEGVLIAFVGAVVGIVLGTVYGWIGAMTVLAEIGPVTLTVPWAHIGIVLGVALLAGLLASALPARAAARTSPVEALAVD